MRPTFTLSRILRCALGGLAAIGLAGCGWGRPPTASRAQQAYTQGALAYQAGDRDRAAASLRKAIDDNPNLVMARFLLGKVYRDQGDYRAALDQYRRVAELAPGVAAHQYSLGLMHHLLNELELAGAAYLKALEIDPKDYKSNMNLALVFTALDRPQEGLPYARQAVEAAPDIADTHSNLAVVLDALAEYPAAEGEYRKAMEIDGEKVEVLYNLGANLLSQGKTSQALRIYERVVQQADSSLARERYGYALLQGRRYDEAVGQFHAALELNDQNWRALNGLGHASLAQYKESVQLDEGKRTEAVECWRRSLAINPEQPQVAELVKAYSQAVLFPE